MATSPSLVTWFLLCAYKRRKRELSSASSYKDPSPIRSRLSIFVTILMALNLNCLEAPSPNITTLEVSSNEWILGGAGETHTQSTTSGFHMDCAGADLCLTADQGHLLL